MLIIIRNGRVLEPSPGLWVAFLEFGDDGVVDVFLLFAEKVVADRVEGVRAQFVIPEKDQEQIKLDTPLDVDTFILSPTHLLALNHRLLDGRPEQQ